MATTVRVDDRLHATLREIARKEHRPIGHVIEDAVAQYQQEKFWQEVEASVERLRADSGCLARLSGRGCPLGGRVNGRPGARGSLFQ
jgi:predicted transcriptional regulator